MIGPNGAGKTTLLSMLAGAARPSEGEVSRPPSERIGWVPQQTAVYSKLSVAENLRLFARLERVADPEAAVAGCSSRPACASAPTSELGRLSGGNRQRVNIAIGAARRPAVLLLDEPSASLDPRQRERLWEFIAARVARRARASSSRPTTSPRPSATPTRVLVLADGELLFGGPPGELAASRAAGRGDLETAFVAFLARAGALRHAMRWLLAKDLRILRRSPAARRSADRLPGRRSPC